MKRALALLLAALIAALACVAAAEVAPDSLPEATAPAGEDAVFREDEAGYDGAWVDFEDGFRLYLPSEWVYYEITGEESEAGLFYRAGNGGSDGIVGGVSMGVAVSCARVEGPQGLEALAERYVSAGFAGVEALGLNGIPAVAFERPEENYRGVAFRHPVYPGYVLSVYVAPLGEAGDAVSELGGSILASLSPFAAPTGEG